MRGQKFTSTVLKLNIQGKQNCLRGGNVIISVHARADSKLVDVHHCAYERQF